MDNKKVCLKKNKGGECLLYGNPIQVPAGNSASDPNSKGPRETFNPMKADVDLPIYYRRIRDFKDKPKYHIVEIDKNRNDYDKAIAHAVSEAAKYGEVKVTNTPSITTVSVHTPGGAIKDLDIANRVKHGLNVTKHVGSTAFKGNAALTALDLANTLYDYRDDIHSIGDVVDVAKDFVDSIPEDTVNQAKAAVNAVLSGDYVTLGDIAYQFTPAPIVTRTIDNVANLAGIEGVDTTGTIQHAVPAIPGGRPMDTQQEAFQPVYANTVGERVADAANKVFKHIKFW